MNELLTALSLLLNFVSEHATNQKGTPLGTVVLIVIESPVVILLLATLLGRPRRMKVTGLFLGWLVMVFLVFLGAIYALSFITGTFF
ncbi:MAG: hypothetical protein JSV27_08855 [Candidatus Bathyarchaeota archaeon]|nr:MAG: hypothetical protein JSV27_08855 [Candidatus Bathyarchaeota archaeon]